MVDLKSSMSDGCFVITIDRPASLNALTQAMKLDLAALVSAAGEDEKVSSIVLVGAGDRAFSAGSDVKEMGKFSPNEVAQMLDIEHRCFESVLSCPKPVVACVRGYALGAGCQLAMCADLAVATADSTFGIPELRFGAVSGNETAMFLYFGGLGFARRLILGCEHIGAEEAMRWGIVSEVVSPTEDALAAGMRVAHRLASYPAKSYARQKALLRLWLDQGYTAAVESSIGAAALAWTDPDAMEAMAHALDKTGATRPTGSA